MSAELISNLANVALSLSVIVAVIFGIIQVQIAARDRRERLTLEALHNFQSREFAELVQYITTHNLPATQEEFQAMPVNEQVMLFQFSQQMESLGMMVYEKLININLVDKTLGSLVIVAWDKYKVMFMDIRVNQPDPFLGEYFQWLAETIDERMKQNPRKPFYVNRHKRQDTKHKT